MVYFGRAAVFSKSVLPRPLAAFGSVHRPGRRFVCELGDRIPDPAPDRYAVVIVGGCQLIGGAVDRRRNLITSNGDAVNSDPTQPSEIVEFTKTGQFVKQLSVDPAQGGSFGLAVKANRQTGTTLFAAVDDNTATLTVYTLPLSD